MPTTTKNPFRLHSGIPVLFLAILLIICALTIPCTAKGGGRGGGGGGRGGGSRSSGSRTSGGSRTSSSSSSSSSSSRTSYGSSGSSGRASSSGSRYGSSAPSGSSGSGYGSGSSGRVSAPRYAVPVSRTYSRIASGSSSAPRPQARSPGRWSGSGYTPTRVVYSTTYVNNYGRMGGYGYYGGGYHGGGTFFPGYYMGYMMSRPYYPYYYGSYVPYRYHYGHYYQTTPSPLTPTEQVRPAEPQKEIAACTLNRWNREISLTELPNMALQFLANDTISGASTDAKSGFMFEMFKSAMDAYEHYNKSADIFTIPSDENCYNNLSSFGSNFAMIEMMSPRKMQIYGGSGFSSDQSSVLTGRGEEPILTSVRNVLYSYSNLSKDNENLEDLVKAAKNCLPRGEVVLQPEVLPCLDFTLTPDELLKLKNPSSVFESEELCQGQLNRDIFKCTTLNSSGSGTCNVQHLLAINAFARDFYLCKSALEADTYAKLKANEVALGILLPPKLEENVVEETNSNNYDVNGNDGDDSDWSSSNILWTVGSLIFGIVIVTIMLVRGYRRRYPSTTTTTQIVVTAENEPLNPYSGVSNGVQGYHPTPIVTGGYPAQFPESTPYNNNLYPYADAGSYNPSPNGSPGGQRKAIAPVFNTAPSPKASKYGGFASTG